MGAWENSRLSPSFLSSQGDSTTPMGIRGPSGRVQSSPGPYPLGGFKFPAANRLLRHVTPSAASPLGPL